MEPNSLLSLGFFAVSILPGPHKHTQKAIILQIFGLQALKDPNMAKRSNMCLIAYQGPLYNVRYIP